MIYFILCTRDQFLYLSWSTISDTAVKLNNYIFPFTEFYISKL